MQNNELGEQVCFLWLPVTFKSKKRRNSHKNNREEVNRPCNCSLISTVRALSSSPFRIARKVTGGDEAEQDEFHAVLYISTCKVRMNWYEVRNCVR